MRWVVTVQWLRSDGGFGDLASIGPRDFSEVEVLADSASEASLVALQMVACRDGVEPVRSWTDGPFS